MESKDPSLGNDVGLLELNNTAETKFSTACENMIESANTNTKTRINVDWIAPLSSNATDCVNFRAGVVQNRNVWFMDDGFLTKTFCPEEIDDMNSQTPIQDVCCACDEAKYEVMFFCEG